MCKVYVTASQKGGVAKTTTAGSLGIGLAKKGYKVLLVDADAQGSLTASLGYKKRYIDKVKDNYDYIIIDSAPSLGLITINVLVAADRIIIPVQRLRKM